MHIFNYIGLIFASEDATCTATLYVVPAVAWTLLQPHLTERTSEVIRWVGACPRPCVVVSFFWHVNQRFRDRVYGAAHLVTATFVQWPNWQPLVSYVDVVNLAAQSVEKIFLR